MQYYKITNHTRELARRQEDFGSKEEEMSTREEGHLQSDGKKTKPIESSD